MQTRTNSLFTQYLKSLNELQAEPDHTFDLERSLQEHPVLKTIVENSPSLSYILDYRSGRYFYISANAQQILGQSQDAFYSDGIDLAFQLYNQEDYHIYCNAIFEKRLRFMRKLKPTDRSHYCYLHNFRVISKRTTPLHLLQECRVLKADAAGNPWVIMGFCRDISHIKTDTRITDAVIRRKPEAPVSSLNVSHYYPKPEDGLLTAKELEILKWILEGESSKAIADRMHISAHTVRTHRKHMHEKTNAKNMADLLRYALDHGLV